MSMEVSKDYTDQELIDAAQRCANVYSKLANQIFSCNLPIPARIKFDLCDRSPTYAGLACGDLHIELNMVLFRDNVRDILNDTIPHEIAHLAQFAIFDRNGANVQGHGAEWQEIMRRLGKDPAKYHKLDTSKDVQHYKTVKTAKRKELKLLKKELSL